MRQGEGPPTCPTHGGATTYGGAFNQWGCPGDPAQPMGGARNAWVVLEPEGVPEPEGCPHRVGGIAVLRGCLNLRGACPHRLGASLLSENPKQVSLLFFWFLCLGCTSLARWIMSCRRCQGRRRDQAANAACEAEAGKRSHEAAAGHLPLPVIVNLAGISSICFWKKRMACAYRRRTSNICEMLVRCSLPNWKG